MMLIKGKMMLFKGKMMIEKFMKRDRGGKEIIIEIGLIVIAVFLIGVFRSDINDIVGAILEDAQENITSLFND